VSNCVYDILHLSRASTLAVDWRPQLQHIMTMKLHIRGYGLFADYHVSFDGSPRSFQATVDNMLVKH
jgi:hypothetical protein